jgi:tRNA-specific adenosine deaminase 1
MSSPPTSNLSESIAATVLAAYASLPPRGKPRSRDNGAEEWTILAGFCLYTRTGDDEEGWKVECVSLG